MSWLSFTCNAFLGGLKEKCFLRVSLNNQRGRISYSSYLWNCLFALFHVIQEMKSIDFFSFICLIKGSHLAQCVDLSATQSVVWNLLSRCFPHLQNMSINTSWQMHGRRIALPPLYLFVLRLIPAASSLQITSVPPVHRPASPSDIVSPLSSRPPRAVAQILCERHLCLTG